MNTIIKYTKIPDENDFSVNESECILISNNPYVAYDVFTKKLYINGPDVNLIVKAKNIHIEEKA